MGGGGGSVSSCGLCVFTDCVELASKGLLAVVSGKNGLTKKADKQNLSGTFWFHF